MATGPHSSLHVTVPQGVMFGGAEQEEVERGECQDVEIGVQELQGNSKDDCTVGRDDGILCSRNT